MTAQGKLSFALIFVICFTMACGREEPGPKAQAPTPSIGAGGQADDEESSLEARCFEGDQAACDELGH